MGKESKIDVGTYYVDTDGAGRVYIPKGIADATGFDNKTKVTVRLEDNKLIVEKLV
jgi:bifunctional DNA-binding transcriptional regulator/antitoxin component of YhaV-PrlF toxin-antitoxin module